MLPKGFLFLHSDSAEEGYARIKSTGGSKDVARWFLAQTSRQQEAAGVDQLTRLEAQKGGGRGGPRQLMGGNRQKQVGMFRVVMTPFKTTFFCLKHCM